MEQPKNEVLSGNSLEAFFNDSYVEPTPQEEATPDIGNFFNEEEAPQEITPSQTTQQK